jgi:head-tail adaptor
VLPERLLPHSVTVQTAGTTTDRYGNTIQDWSDPDTRVIRGRFEMLLSDAVKLREETDGRDSALSVWRFYTNDIVDMRERLVWDGKTFDIDGQVSPTYGLTGPHHYEALARVR